MIDDDRLVAEHRVGEGVPFPDRHRRQVHAVSDIAHRVDIRNIGARMLVHRDAAIDGIERDAGLFQT